LGALAKTDGGLFLPQAAVLFFLGLSARRRGDVIAAGTIPHHGI